MHEDREHAILERIAKSIHSGLAEHRKAFFQHCVNLLSAIKNSPAGPLPASTQKIELNILTFQLYQASVFLSDKNYLDSKKTKQLANFLWLERYRLGPVAECDRLARRYFDPNSKEKELIADFYDYLHGAIHYENPDSVFGMPTLSSSANEIGLLINLTAKNLIISSRHAVASAFDDQLALSNLRQQADQENKRIDKLLG